MSSFVRDLPITSVVVELESKLGPTLVAYIAGSRLQSVIGNWRTGSYEPPADAQVRLRVAMDVFWNLSQNEGDDVAREAMIGQNSRCGASGHPEFDYNSICDAIRADRFVEARAGARAVIEDQFSD